MDAKKKGQIFSRETEDMITNGVPIKRKLYASGGLYKPAVILFLMPMA
jgi:hypothetical protein